MSSDYATEKGGEVLAAAVRHGLEGIVAKRLASEYRPATVTGDWLRVCKGAVPWR